VCKAIRSQKEQIAAVSSSSAVAVADCAPKASKVVHTESDADKPQKEHWHTEQMSAVLRRDVTQQWDALVRWWEAKSKKSKATAIRKVIVNVPDECNGRLEKVDTGLNIKSLLGKCACSKSACGHGIPNQVLHEMYIRSKPQALVEDYAHCVSHLYAEPTLDKSSKVYALVNDPTEHKEQLVEWQQGNFPTWEESLQYMRESVQRSLEYMRCGQPPLVRDLTAWQCAEKMCYHFTALCVGLLDQYFTENFQEDRCMLVRTSGCTKCGGSCLAQDAIRCNACENAFWCSGRCRNGEAHRSCPGRPVLRQLQLDL